ncbi:MAG TPA: ABC transporter substrate-binding protein [Candidatus Limnocylindrales bacterium]|nr:ABC transporter substrate-binding protein [Candidatus Limnocylindrales bacterium]
MPARIQRHTMLLTLAVLAAVALVASDVAQAQTPRRGGVLLAASGADPPSLDPHQESTFANVQLVAPLYSTLLQFDPLKYPNIIGDVGTEWKTAPDGLTVTVKIRSGIRFHDGSTLTAADVKATYDKIVFPPAGTRSVRKAHYSAVKSIESPDASTVVFTLKHPSASFLANLASPWNAIFPKKYLDKDPNHFMKNVVGSGPFKFKSYVRGATFEGERNPDYYVKDRPYLDGYKFFISPDTSVRSAAVRSGRAYIEFRGFPNSEVDAIKNHLGDKVVVQSAPTPGWWAVTFNNQIKPFNDERVRKALTLAIDRHTASKVLYPLTGLQGIGALVRPGSEFAMSNAELEKLPGFGRDIEKSRAEAKKLLAEAGYPNGLKFVMKNRNVKLPYQDFAVFFIQEWKKIGVEVENRPLETAAWFADGRDTGNFEAMVDPHVDFMDEPDLSLVDFISGNSANWGRISDPQIDDLFERQSRALDKAERKKLVNQLERIVLEKAYYAAGLWWTRNVVHWAKVKNWVTPPSHYSNQKLQDVWLSED